MIAGAGVVEGTADSQPPKVAKAAQLPAVKWEWSSDNGWEEFGSVETASLTKAFVGGQSDVLLQVTVCAVEGESLELEMSECCM